MQPNELYHYGVIGMKWGVRRYHNKDGAPTDAGRRLTTKVKDASKYIQAGDAETKRLVEKIIKEGYTVNSAYVLKAATVGMEHMKRMVGYIPEEVRYAISSQSKKKELK